MKKGFTTGIIEILLLGLTLLLLGPTVLKVVGIGSNSDLFQKLSGRLDDLVSSGSFEFDGTLKQNEMLVQLYIPTSNDGVLAYTSYETETIEDLILNEKLKHCQGTTCICLVKSMEQNFDNFFSENYKEKHCAFFNDVTWTNVKKPFKEINVKTEEGELKSQTLDMERRWDKNYGFSCYNYYDNVEQPKSVESLDHYRKPETKWLILQEIAAYTKYIRTLEKKGIIEIQECASMPLTEKINTLTTNPFIRSGEYYITGTTATYKTPIKPSKSCGAYLLETPITEKNSYLISNIEGYCPENNGYIEFDVTRELITDGTLSFQLTGFYTGNVMSCLDNLNQDEGELNDFKLKPYNVCSYSGLNIVDNSCDEFNIYQKGDISLGGKYCAIINPGNCDMKMDDLSVIIKSKNGIKEYKITNYLTMTETQKTFGFMQLYFTDANFYDSSLDKSITQITLDNPLKIIIQFPEQKTMKSYTACDSNNKINDEIQMSGYYYAFIKNFKITHAGGTYPPDVDEIKNFETNDLPILLVPENSNDYAPLLYIIADTQDIHVKNAKIEYHTASNTVLLKEIKT